MDLIELNRILEQIGMLDIQGIWHVSYTNIEIGEDPQEFATLRLEGGSLSGTDPWGGVYEGRYSIDGQDFEAQITVTGTSEGDENVFDLPYPIEVAVKGKYTSPEYFSASAIANGQLDRPLPINCTRIQELIGLD